MFKTIVMTPEEHQTIKALAKIVVEGIVNHVKKNSDERTNQRQSSEHSSSHSRDSILVPDNLAGKLKVIS